MENFIYTIKELFNPDNGCLFHYKVKGYYIASYQRGYKWKSTSVYDQVPVLLLDLYEAFLKSETTRNKQEYYLQYITVKKRADHYFEVIDGQQRLTTLTLIFNVLERFYAHANLAKTNGQYVVTYARYDKATTHIFDHILNLIDSGTDAANEPEQDKFYMLKASICIKDFFELLNEQNQDNFKKFLDYFKNHVKLILNIEDEHTSAEEVFANLNDNKVPLTNAYLIKGLLLTRASRLTHDATSKKHFKEIIDQRAIMGRMWDEMNAWFSLPEVSYFFFGTKDEGMENMLRLIHFDNDQTRDPIIQNFKSSFTPEGNKFNNPYILFNNYHQNVITANDAARYLNEIQHNYKRLKSWFYDNELYHLIGYYLVVNNYKAKDNSEYGNDIASLLNEPSNDHVKKKLQQFVLDQLPKDDKKWEKLGYQQYKPTFFLLLAINVFQRKENENGNFRKYRFDFYSFVKEDWSLEHIFPQKPNAKNLNIEDDKTWILEKVREKRNELTKENKSPDEIERYDNLISEIESNIEIDPNTIGFVFEEIKNPDDLGNMALLSRGVNSALSNAFFNAKRKILLRKINAGSFVPKHTIDVFSKMLDVQSDIALDNSLTVWSAHDIETHKKYLKEQVDLLTNQMQVV